MRNAAAVALCCCAFVLVSGASAQDPSSGQGEGLSGTVDVRHRFVDRSGGFDDVYRSIVNLGEGPRLDGADLRFRPARPEYADEATFHAGGWGGDPYTFANFSAQRRDLYELRLDYRSFAYFNNLPSFANPLLSEGLLLSQRKMDVARRNLDFRLDFKPQSTVSPFVAYGRSAGDGRGVTNFVSDGDEFPVSTDFDDVIHTVRGGVELRIQRWSAVVEQGRTSFSDDQTAAFSAGGNRGNRRTPLFGSDLVLDQFDQRYRARGDGLFERVAVQGNPARWLGLTGQFLHSRPSLDVTQDLSAQGEFASFAFFSPFANQSESSLADASRPRTNASWTTEVRPVRRVRILQSWYTDRYHVSSASSLSQLLDTSPERLLEATVDDRLELDFSRHQVEVVYDPDDRFTLRGGHRYESGAGRLRAPSLDWGGEGRPGQGELRRHVGLAGAAFRGLQGKLRLSADFEASPGDKTFFRTGLMDYRKGRAQVRFRPRSDLSVSGSFSFLDNRNDDPAIDLDYGRRETGVNVAWTPSDGPLSVVADYAHVRISSDVQGVQLPFFGTELLSYRDRGHHGGAYLEFRLPSDVSIQTGGAYSVTSGSRPTRYYQPRAEAAGRLAKRLRWKAEWRWYGFRERLFNLESFRTHVVSVGFQREL